MKIIFMGTPEFAVGALEAIIAAGHEVVLAVTQPDKPKGRGKAVQFPPVKECAIRHGIPVFQPVRIKEEEAVETLKTYDADLFVVAAFGQILSSEILNMPRFGCINIHASLLPKYRGAAPIQWAILDGEKKTGVTIMQMNEGLDTGDMLSKKEVEIDATDTGDSLHDKLMVAGAELVVETLPDIEAGNIHPQKQNDEDSCYAKMLKKNFGQIDWTESARQIERKVRAFNSWPGCYTFRGGKQIKIWEAEVAGESEEKENGLACGKVICVKKDSVIVQTGSGLIGIKEIQPVGKKKMPVKDYLLGYPVTEGETLGE